MSALQNDRLLRALAREPVDRTPVWLMRQAGRYLPEYRATRAKAGSFLNLATNPELACEVTLQPLARYPLDAAILFSDILMIPKAMGVGLAFEEGEGPRIERPLRSASDIDALPVPDLARELRFVFDAVALVRRELAGRVPLIGFAGSPWTVATYMIEGGSSRDFPARRRSPMATRRRCTACWRSSRAPRRTTSMRRSPPARRRSWFSTPGAGRCRRRLSTSSRFLHGEHRGRHDPRARRPPRPVILFTKGGGAWLERLSAAGADALGVDWTTELSAARRDTFGRVALQGNLDPGSLFAPPEAIRAEVGRVWKATAAGRAMCSTLAMASSRASIRRAWQRWWQRCRRCRRRTTGSR